MTVRQLESALADMPSDAEVRIAVGVFGGLAVQSIERLPEHPDTVWLANELDNDLTPEQAHAIVDRELGAEITLPPEPVVRGDMQPWDIVQWDWKGAVPASAILSLERRVGKTTGKLVTNVRVETGQDCHAVVILPVEVEDTAQAIYDQWEADEESLNAQLPYG